jgi:Ca2+-binding RTX toxin-like protein
MSELTTAQASTQFGTQISGVQKVDVVTKADGTRQFTTDPTKPATIGYSSTSTVPVEYITGAMADSLISSSPSMKVFDLREGDDTARIEGGSFLGKLGTGNDKIDIINSNGTIVGGAGSDTINISGNSKVTIEYNPGDFGAFSSPMARMRRGMSPKQMKNGRNKLGGASDVDKITGFSSDDVLRISKAALPGGEKLAGADGFVKSLKTVNGINAVRGVKGKEAMIIYDKTTGDLYYNPANVVRGKGDKKVTIDTRPVKLLQLDANLDLAPTNIVIF